MSEEAPPTWSDARDLVTLLRPFKLDQTTNDAAAALVIGDDEAVRVLAAFRNVEHSWRLPKKKRPSESSSLIARWLWLTSNWSIDIEGVARAAGMSEEVAEMKLQMLVDNRLVYPDGSIAYGATIALQMHTQMKMGVKPKLGTPQKKNDTKKENDNGNRPKE